MNEILRMKLFRLFSESSQVTNKEMENAYGCFVEQLRAVSQSERNYLEIYRILDTTRIELLFIESLYRYEQGKKCPEIYLPQKSCPVS